MRLITFLLLTAHCVWAQSPRLLPSFESSHLQEIWIDTQLKGQPQEFSIEEYNYNRDSARLYKSPISKQYFYELGRLRKVVFKKTGSPIKTYLYDTHGRIIEQLRTDSFESIPRITYTYNDEDLIAEEVVYRVTGTVHSKTILRFNDRLQLISKEEYRGTQQLNRYWLYAYNSQNDLVSDEYYDIVSNTGVSANTKPEEPKPNLRTEILYTYDTRGLRTTAKTLKNELLHSVSHTRHFPDSLVNETVYYQASGWPSEKLVEIQHDSARVVIKGYYNTEDTTSYRARFREIYVYNDLVEYESRTLKGTFVDRYATFYEYDHLGNWIKKTTYSNGVVLKVEERRIRY
ncbi:hypothetical protein [Roseivirga thermotolerans]|uniref:hypothetical protein n=1 Tax=Roseivirga thermotolerans TaxID=1758176 RepID=UPI00273E2D9C|nr:hypothetical protein [Roseivirga thermotolerans]